MLNFVGVSEKKSDYNDKETLDIDRKGNFVIVQ